MQIPSSVLYAMKQVKTIEDVLELLDQTGSYNPPPLPKDNQITFVAQSRP